MTSVSRHGTRVTGAAWAFSFLSTLASVVFAMGAIVAWVLGLWPATPLTLGIAAFVVVGGPLLAAVHLRNAQRVVRPEPVPVVPAPTPAPARMIAPTPAPRRGPVLRPRTPEQVWGAALLDWRDRPRQRA